MMRERSWFMMRVAHNLRAPLAATMSILEVVQSNYLGELNERQAAYLRRIEYPIRNMLTMINELMVLYAQRSEKKQTQFTAVDLRLLVVRVQKIFQEQAEKKQIAFEVNIPDPLPTVNGNGEMLEQLLENLISNAIKYTVNGGRVKVCCHCPKDDTVCLEVRDTGIGIPKNEMPRLFTEFFRAENARELERVGTGLGLSIVKEIVNEHGGQINVESEEGQGTAFFVKLPARIAAAENKRASIPSPC